MRILQTENLKNFIVMDISDAQGTCVIGVLRNFNCVFNCTKVWFQSVDAESHSTQFWIDYITL